MKVLTFIRRFNDNTHTFIYNTITGLQAAGCEVWVSCVQRVEEAQYPFENLRLLPFSVPARIWNNFQVRTGLCMYYANPPLRRGLHRLVREFQPDVIHCHFGPDALYFLDNFSGRSTPVFISFHGFDASIMLRNTLYRRRLQEVFARPYVFPIFVSEFMRDNIRAHGIEVPRSFILYYGTDTDFFQRRHAPPAPPPFVFLQVSSFREKKGHEYTLRAFASMREQHPEVDARLILAGDGPLRAPMEAFARSLGIADRVSFPGFLSPVQARDLMEQAHAFVHHSVTGSLDGDMEGIPNALMEAMAMALPVISTYHSGIPELVTDGVHGYLVEEKDVLTYAQRLYEITGWPLQPCNREQVERLFEKEQHARRLTEYYRQAIDQLEGGESN